MSAASITRDFLGAEPTWQAAGIEMEDVQPLWGGHRLVISGRGQADAQSVAADGKVTRGHLYLPAGEVRRLLALCCEHDLLATPPPTHPGLPDEAQPTITLINPAGERRGVTAWAEGMADGFAAVYKALHALARRALAVTATRTRLAELDAQLQEKGYALDRFSHQPSVVTFIEQEIAGLESQIAAHRQTLARLTTFPSAKEHTP